MRRRRRAAARAPEDERSLQRKYPATCSFLPSHGEACASLATAAAARAHAVRDGAPPARAASSSPHLRAAAAEDDDDDDFAGCQAQ